MALGAKSLVKLNDCDPNLRAWVIALASIFPLTVVWAFRDEASQTEAYNTGKSQKPWPQSNHNVKPCMAVDLAPMPEIYGRTDEEKKAAPINFAYMAGHGMALAKQMGLDLRWGGDWNRNLTTSDEHFKDMGHFEIFSAPKSPLA